MGKVSRRRFLSCCAAVAACSVIPLSPAFAFSSSGNIVADFTYAINRNRGVTIDVAKEIAAAAGAATAGTSLWSRILKRTPLRRIFWIANLAGAAYAIYQIISDSYAPTGATNYSDTGWNTLDATFPVANLSLSVPSDQFNAVQATLPAGAICALTNKDSVGSTWIVVARMVTRAPDNTVGHHIEYRAGTGAAINKGYLWDSEAMTAYYKTGGSLPNNNGSFTPQSTDVISGADRWYRGYYSFQGLAPTTQWRWVNKEYPVTHPDDVPANADLIADTIAEDVNEAYRKAKLANPALPQMAPITAAEIAAVAPAGSPARKKSTATATDPMPRPIVDNDPDGSPAGPSTVPTDGAGSGGGSDPDWSTQPVVVPIPDDKGIPSMPVPDAIDDRLGVNVCPALPNGITTHCAPLSSARPFLIATTRLAGTVATFLFILKD